jgi:hypothetical protein
MKEPLPAVTPAKSRLGRVLDSFIEAVAPRAALERGRARTMLSHGGARPSRERNSQFNRSWNPDSPRVNRDAVAMMFEARDLAENVGFVKGHLRKVQLYGAGTLTYEPNTGDPGMDSEISACLDYWYTVCHTGLEHVFTRLIQLALIGMTRDRDSLLVFQRDLDMLRLQLVEADQIGELYGYSRDPGYIAGVYRNSDGTRRGYKIFERVGDMQYRLGPDKGFVPAQDALFFCDPMRNSVRGITAYDTSITNIRDKFEILGYEKIAVKDISTTGIITYTQAGVAEPFDFDRTEQKTNSAGTTVNSYIQHRESGTREFRGIGEKFEVVPHNRPSNTFQGFLKTLDSENCQGLNLPFGFVVDPSEPGGVAARIIAHIANREFERIQRDVLLPNLNKIRTIVLGDFIERGDLSRHPRFNQGIWMFPPPPTADIQRESDISIREVRAGLSTYTEQYAMYGQSRKRQWDVKMMEAVERHVLAYKATKMLSDMGIDSVVQPDEIATLSDNPANDPNQLVPAIDIKTGKPIPKPTQTSAAAA